MHSLAGAEAGSVKAPYVYSLFTGDTDMKPAGHRAHDILEQTSIKVLNGIGVSCRIGAHDPHVRFETARPVTKKAGRRLGNAGLHLVAGEPITP